MPAAKKTIKATPIKLPKIKVSPARKAMHQAAVDTRVENFVDMTSSYKERPDHVLDPLLQNKSDFGILGKSFKDMTPEDKDGIYHRYVESTNLLNRLSPIAQAPISKAAFLDRLQRSSDKMASGLNRQVYVNEAFKDLMTIAAPVLTEGREVDTLSPEEKANLYSAYKDQHTSMNVNTKFFFSSVDQKTFEGLIIPLLKEELDKERAAQVEQEGKSKLEEIQKHNEGYAEFYNKHVLHWGIPPSKMPDPKTLKIGVPAPSYPLFTSLFRDTLVSPTIPPHLATWIASKQKESFEQEAKKSPLIVEMGEGAEMFSGFMFINGLVEKAPDNLINSFKIDMVNFQDRVSYLTTGGPLSIGLYIGGSPFTGVKKKSYFENIEGDYRVRNLANMFESLDDFRLLINKVKKLKFTGTNIDKAASQIFLYAREVKSMGFFTPDILRVVVKNDADKMQVLTTAVEFFRLTSSLKRCHLFNTPPYNSTNFEVALSFDITPKERFERELKARVTFLTLILSQMRQEMNGLKYRSDKLYKEFQNVQCEYNNEIEKTKHQKGGGDGYTYGSNASVTFMQNPSTQEDGITITDEVRENIKPERFRHL